MKGSGNTDGGLVVFGIGFLLSAVAIWFFLDSVIATTAEHGMISGMMRGGRRGGGGHGGGGGGRGLGYTTSMGIIFVPFLIGVITLFYDASKRWGWWLLYIGLGVITIEILSHIRFMLSMKTSHLIAMFVMFGAGVGLMLRSYKQFGGEAINEAMRDSLGQPGDKPPARRPD